MILTSVLILEVMVVLGLTSFELMQGLIPLSEMVRGGLKKLLIVELITMEM